MPRIMYIISLAEAELQMLLELTRNGRINASKLNKFKDWKLYFMDELCRGGGMFATIGSRQAVNQQGQAEDDEQRRQVQDRLECIPHSER